MIEITSFASSSRANAYYITDGRTSLLIEAGVRFKDLQRAMKFNLSSLAGCLVTHEHQDHSRSVKDLIKAGMDCYMSYATAEALGVHGHRMHIVKARQGFTIGSWSIMPFDTIHDAEEPLGFFMESGYEKLLFITDSAYVKYRFVSITHLMIECNYIDEVLERNVQEGFVSPAQKHRLLRSHFSLKNVTDMLRANDLSKLKETWLLHLSGDNSDAEQMKRIVQGITGKPVYVPEA